MARPDAVKADEAIRAFVAQQEIPSAHVKIVRGDEVVLQRGYGATGPDGRLPDATSVFPLGSISKQFTAAATLALADTGKVRFDAPVGGVPAGVVRQRTRPSRVPPALTDLGAGGLPVAGGLVPYGFGLSTREFLGHAMVWHAGNVDSHSTMIAYLPADDLGLVVFTSKGLVWLTELLPALIGATPPARAAASDAPLSGHFEDGLFRSVVTPQRETMRVTIDLIGTFDFVPAAPREFVAEELPATFRMRLPMDGSRDSFELDLGETRSYASRVRDYTVCSSMFPSTSTPSTTTPPTTTSPETGSGSSWSSVPPSPAGRASSSTSWSTGPKN